MKERSVDGLENNWNYSKQSVMIYGPNFLCHFIPVENMSVYQRKHGRSYYLKVLQHFA